MKGIAKENVFVTMLNFFLYAGIAVTLLLVTIVRSFHPKNVDADIDMVFTILFSSLLAIRVLFSVAYLASISRKLQNQLTPRSLWRACLKSECQTLFKGYAIATTILMTLIIFVGAASFIFPLMLVSLTCSLCLIFALAINGFFNRKLKHLVLFSFGAAATILIISGASETLLSNLQRLPALFQFLIACLMPATLAWQIYKPTQNLLLNNISTEKTRIKTTGANVFFVNSDAIQKLKLSTYGTKNIRHLI